MSIKQKVGLLTIGQSPRTDITPTIQSIIGPHIDIVEAGALDFLSEAELTKVRPKATDAVFVSRLRNGQSIHINKAALLPLLEKALKRIEDRVSVIIMLCTGDVPSLTSVKPIIYPDKLLKHLIYGIHGNEKIGIIVPVESQKTTLLHKWGNIDVVAEAASPYEDSDIKAAAQSLKAQGASLLVLDCIGYQEKHKQEAFSATGLPVILPQTLVARVAAELVYSS